MGGSGGVTRERESDLRGVKDAVRGFFRSGQGTKGKDCGICLGGRSSVELGEEVVGVVLQALLFPPEEKEKLEERRTSLWLCEECGASLSTLIDLFLRLEELRVEFNDLRRRMGRQVILGSLGRSEEEFAGWEEEAKAVEHVFPSCVKWRMEEGGAAICDSPLEEDEEEDAKLNKMIPLVLLERLEEPPTPTHSTEVTETFEVYVKSEAEDAETADEFDEVDDDLFSVESFKLEETSEEEEKTESDVDVSRQPLRKRRRLDLNDIDTEEQSKSDVKTGEDSSAAAEEMATEEMDVNCCRICDKTFSRKDHVKRHIANIHGKMEANKLEAISVDSRRQLRKQRQNDLNDNGIQEQSKEGDSDVEDDDSDTDEDSSGEDKVATTSTTTKKRRHPCKHCKQTFARNYGLQRHIASVHNGTRTKVKCVVCQRLFRDNGDLLRHQLKFHSVATYDAPPQIPCTHCHLTFPDPSALKLHQLRRHLLGSTTSGDPQCPFCLEFFPDESSLVKHQQKFHFGGRPPPPACSEEGHSPQNVRCFLCKTLKGPLTPEDLKAHEESAEHQQKIRSKSSAYCDVCRLNFASDLDALQLHLNSPEHQKEVDNLGDFDNSTFCILCRKSFSSHAHLITHSKNPAHLRKRHLREMRSCL